MLSASAAAMSRILEALGREKWNRRWLYEELKLFNGYRVRRESAMKANAASPLAHLVSPNLETH